MISYEDRSIKSIAACLQMSAPCTDRTGELKDACLAEILPFIRVTPKNLVDNGQQKRRQRM